MKSNTLWNPTKIIDVIGSDEGFISSISVQKKNKYRYSIYVDEQFLVGISETTFVQFGLKRGDIITQEILEKIQNFEETILARDYLLKLLSRRDHSSKELVQKGLKKGYLKRNLETSIEELKSKGYIDNNTFAKKFTYDKFHFNRWGKEKIKIELVKKGVSEGEINSALSTISFEDQQQSMESLFEKSRARFLRTTPEKRRKKIFDFFYRKGYPADSINKLMNAFIESLN